MVSFAVVAGVFPATAALMIVGLVQGSDERDTTVATSQSLTARVAVGRPRGHADVLRESVASMVREIMELEVSQLAGAELEKRAAEQRTGQGNRYRERRWDVRVGESELQIQRLRTGNYPPSFRSPAGRRTRGCGNLDACKCLEVAVGG